MADLPPPEEQDDLESHRTMMQLVVQDVLAGFAHVADMVPQAAGLQAIVARARHRLELAEGFLLRSKGEAAAPGPMDPVDVDQGAAAQRIIEGPSQPGDPPTALGVVLLH